MSLAGNDLLRYLRENSIDFVSFCFSDFNAKIHRMTYHTDAINEDLLASGIGFDGSSIASWKEINCSDSLMMPDFNTLFLDPFTAQKSVIIMCDIIDPASGNAYSKDPRSIAKKAENFALSIQLADSVNVGPEMEFFIFDEVRYINSPNESSYKFSSTELKNDNGYIVHTKSGYCPAQPVDNFFDIRSEICSALKDVGISPSIHHHEVATSQCEVGFAYSSLVGSADNVQKFKYIAQNIAATFGKSATFMPKPIFGDNGSGMHTHFSLVKGGKNLFFDKDGYAQLSQMSLYFIAGIIKHAKALNAFTNPTTNSYKRLVPGYEAPVNLAFSQSNRSAAIRIPYSLSDKAKRIEVRFPDPLSNPYLGFAAMLMAGIDGIINKIEVPEPMDCNLYQYTGPIEKVSSSLQESLANLDSDRAFLTNGHVFSDDMIDSYISHKQKECDMINNYPNPMEFQLYYA